MTIETESGPVFVGGRSRLPKEYEPQAFLDVVVAVDMETDGITNASFSPCPELIAEFLKKELIGKNLRNDEELILNVIDRRIEHRLKKPVLAAVRDLVRNYVEFRKPAGVEE